MELSTILAFSLVLLLTISIFLSWSRQHRHKSLPPGPTPIPLLGTPKYITFFPVSSSIEALIQKYGSVFTIWKMSEPVIVLCGYETMKEALINHGNQFSDRPDIPVMHFFGNGYNLVGPRWSSLRRFVTTCLRNAGMGRKAMEIKVLQENKYLIKAVSEEGGKPFNPLLLLGYAATNIISTLMLGEHFDYQDEKLKELLQSTFRYQTQLISPLNTLCNLFPVLLKFPIISQKVYKEHYFLTKLFNNYINEHKETLNPKSPRDFIDHFLLKMKEVENEVDPDFCDKSLIEMILGLLPTAAVSMASTLKFSVVLLAHYPEVQAKVQQEIDKATKSFHLPKITDKAQMPYTNAVIHEIQRVHDLAPAAFPHAVSEDIVFRGYTIPKGTTVIPFLTSVLQDPSQWETPEDFNPGHFLNEDGQFRTRMAFMPFSAGKRVCLGESFVRMQVFLQIPALLQKFTFTLPPGTKRQDSRYLNRNKVEILTSAEICAVPRASTK
ncbi:cytochrome P450 2C3-like [Anomaloglossus baeobatrachus]|uniref:cytochrome P450 2C3-like n=1 Tax=Anomaloglossus baeobatrachus TaxID=238106 RepID=UPI003F5041FD